MNKKVFVNNKEEIELVFSEKIEEKELIKMLDIANDIIKDMKKNSLPINILADVNKLNNITISARKYGSNWLLKQSINKVAIYGDNLFMKYFIKMLISGLGFSKKMSFFTTRKEAQDWLK